MTLPSHVNEIATACQLEVVGWDDDSDDAIVRGEDVNYVGTKAEVVAFLTAWQQCVGLKIRREMLADGADRVWRGLIGVDSIALIDPAESVQLIVRPQVSAFRGERVGIPRRIAPCFDVIDIRVGNKLVFLSAQVIAGDAFAIPDNVAELVFGRDGAVVRADIAKPALAEFGMAFSMPMLQVAMDLVMTVVNTSDRPLRFQAVVTGKYAA